MDSGEATCSQGGLRFQVRAWEKARSQVSQSLLADQLAQFAPILDPLYGLRGAAGAW